MLEALLLVFSLCIDTCVASFAYGTDQIKIPLKSSLVLTGISTGFLALSLSIGSLISNAINSKLASILCFSILFLLGIMRLFEGLLKTFLNKKAASPDHVEMNLFNFRLVLKVYADVTLADIDHSKVLSSKEALYLGIVLSLDSLLVGLGAALTPISFYIIIVLSIVINLLAIMVGCFIGRRYARASQSDFSWLSGGILMLLAITKLF